MRVRRLWLVAFVAAAALALGGCSGPPDMSGIWQGEVQFEDEGTLILTLDTEQNNEGGLSGTMRTLEKGEPADEERSIPISSGEVLEDGNFQVVAEQQSGFGTSSLNVDGQVDGDQMDAQLSVGGPSLNYEAERISEEEAQRREEEREQVRLEAERREEAAEEEQAELEDAYETLDSEVADAVGSETNLATAESTMMSGELSGINPRLTVLQDPAAILQEELGPENPESEDANCLYEPVSCVISDYEAQVQDDRETFEEEGYNQDGCDLATDRENYDNYTSVAEESGADYVELRDNLQEASSGLQEDADAAVETARDMAEAREAAEQGGVDTSEPEYTVSEVEALAEEAGPAQARTEEAIAAAEERFNEYERRGDELTEQALALQDQAGCVSEE